MSVKVYLAGPINDQTVDQAGSWRDQWAERLLHMGMMPVDPFDKTVREELARAGALGNLDQKAEELGLATASQIVAGSLAMVDACDVILMNLLDLKKNGTVTIGTPIELIFATLCQTLRGLPAKKVIILANDVKSSFFTLANHVVDSEDALWSLLQPLPATA